MYVHGFDVERGLDVLTCLQAADGRELWRHERPARRFAQDHEGGTLTTPSVDGDRVYLGEREGTISCLESASGRLLWHKDLARILDVDPGMYGFAGSPLVLGELLIVNADKVVALGRATGDFVWVTPSFEAVYSTPLPFDLAGKPCVAIFGQKALQLLDLELGGTLRTFPWQEDPRVVCAASPVAVGSRLFVSSAYDHGCALVDFEDGETRAVWASKSMRSKMAGCILLGGFLYGFDESLLKCLGVDGNERWRVRGLGNGALSGGDGKLALLSSRGELVVAEAAPEVFRELSRADLFDEGVFWTPPVIVNGFVYCRSSRGRLVCRDHRPGAAREPVASAPAAREEELPSADELLAGHVARAGGAEALRGLRSMRLTGTYEMRSQGFVPVPLSIDWLAPDKKRIEHRDVPPRPFLLRRVFDGELLWEVDPLGARLLPEVRRREARAADLHLAPDLLERYPVRETTGVVTFHGRACHRVEARSAEGEARTLYFDLAQGLLAGHEGPSGGITVLDGYREFEGLLLPSAQTCFAPDTGIEETLRIERVGFDAIDPQLFARPAGLEAPAETSKGERVTR